MNKILVPCDFSDTSENALNYAVELAKYISGELILLHVTQLPVISTEYGLTSYSMPDNNSEKIALQELADTIQKKHPQISKIDCYSETGSITDYIIEYSRNNSVIFTVMGISGHGNKLMKLFLGSTAVNVSKEIESSLIIVPPDTTFKKPQNIAYACNYDIDIESNSSLIKVKQLNTLLNSDLYVLHVIPENHDLNTKESEIDQFVENSLENSLHKTFMIADNNVSEGLIEFIENHEIDLIIMEPKKHSFFHNLFYPSITNEIAFYSPVPVLTIHG